MPDLAGGLRQLSKRFAYETIAAVRDVPNRWKSGPGGSDFVHRLNWDPRRKHKDRALVIYLKESAAAKDKVSVLRTPGKRDHCSSGS